MERKQSVDAKRDHEDLKTNKDGKDRPTLNRRNSSKKSKHYDSFTQLQGIYGPRENTIIKDERVEDESKMKKKRKKRRKKKSDGDKVNNMKELYDKKEKNEEDEKRDKNRKKKKKPTERAVDNESPEKQKQKIRNGVPVKKNDTKNTNHRNENGEKSTNKYKNNQSSAENKDLGKDENGDEYASDDFEEDEESYSSETDFDDSGSDDDGSEESNDPQSEHSQNSESESELNVASEDDNFKQNNRSRSRSDSEEVRNSPPLPAYTPAPPLYQSPEHRAKQVEKNSTVETYLNWDLEQHGPNISIDETNSQVASRKVAKQSTDGARTQQGFSKGRHTFEFQFNDRPWGSHCSIGVCSASTKLHAAGYSDLFGTDGNSWAWDIPSRELLVNDDILGKYCDGFAVPKTITMILDCDYKELWFEVSAIDDVSPCLHFTDVSVENGDLYPAVSMVYGLTEVMIKLKDSTYREEKTENDGKIAEPEPAPEDRLTTDQEETEDEKCLTSTTSLHDTDFEDDNKHIDDKERNYYPTKKEDPTSSVSRSDDNKPKHDQDEEDDDDEELEEEVALVSLPETERHLLTIGHAWDDISRAGRLHLHPNAPDVCVPARNFGDKVQGLKSRRPLKKGRHCWLLQEVQVYEPECKGEDGKPNNLIIGIVNEGHRTFNYGFSLAQLGRHAWGWEPSTSKFWHGSGWTRYPPYQDDDDKDVDKFCSIDMSKGLVVALDIRKHTFEFIAGQKSFGVASASITGQCFYPFMVYNGQAHKPVRIKYLGGPKSHLVAILEEIAKSPARDLDDVMHCKMIHGGSVRRSTTKTLEDKYRSNLLWGQRSINAQTEGNKASIPIGATVVTDAWFGAGRHVIEFEVLSGSPVLGAVGSDFPGYKAQNEAMVPLLGSCLQSWGWDIGKRSIYHAGICIGRYPPLHLDFDIGSHARYRMTMVNGLNGEGMVSFSAIFETGAVQDLGVAFVNLPNSCWAAASCSVSGDVASLNVFYISGPEELVQQLTSMSSSVCTIL